MQEDRKYCVYVHRSLVDGRIFYVGSGTIERSISISGRNTLWKSVVDSEGFYVEVLFNNLDKKTSFVREYETYEKFVGTCDLVNSRKPSRLHVDPVELICERFLYDTTSPTLIRYKTDVYKGRSHSVLAAQTGDVAGSRVGKRPCVSINNRPYFIHRIVWVLHFGEITEGYFVDHIDGNSENNLIENLRVIPHKINTRNRKIPITNKSGVMGVNLLHHKGEPCRWSSDYRTLCGKRKVKYFSISKYGYDEAFHLACEWRTEQIRLLNEQGAGYTERHGT